MLPAKAHFLNSFWLLKQLQNSAKSDPKSQKNEYEKQAQEKELFCKCQPWRGSRFSAPEPSFWEFRLDI